MFVRAIQRLVALRGRIPAHTDRQHVRIDGALQRREIELQALSSFCSYCSRQPVTGTSGVKPIKPFWFFKCSSQRRTSAHSPSVFPATTTRVTMLPGKLLVGVFGPTSAARNACFLFFAKSPNSSTCDSLPSSAFAAN